MLFKSEQVRGVEQGRGCGSGGEVEERRERREAGGQGALGRHRCSLGPLEPSLSSAGKGQCCPEPAGDTGWAFPGWDWAHLVEKGSGWRGAGLGAAGVQSVGTRLGSAFCDPNLPLGVWAARERETCLASQFSLPPPLHPPRQRRCQKTPGESTPPLTLGASRSARHSLLHRLNSWKWKVRRCEMTLVFRARAEKLSELAWWCFPRFV